MKASLFDSKNFDKTGTLLEPEYNAITRTLVKMLDKFRVPSIRKWLEFKPAEFDKYIEEALKTYNMQFSPIDDREMNLDIKVISFAFLASFQANYFPELIREYKATGNNPNYQIVEFTDLGYVQLPSNYFRSIILSNHEICKDVRKRYNSTRLFKDLSPHIEPTTQFIIPPTVEFNPLDDMFVRLQLDVIL